MLSVCNSLVSGLEAPIEATKARIDKQRDKQLLDKERAKELLMFRGRSFWATAQAVVRQQQ